jgi:lantibiotic modifying enzyme
MEPGLYSGTLGVHVFLANVAAVAHADVDVGKLLNQLSSQHKLLFENVERAKRLVSHYGIGVGAGAGSFLYGLALLKKITGNTEYIDCGNNIIAAISELPQDKNASRTGSVIWSCRADIRDCCIRAILGCYRRQ